MRRYIVTVDYQTTAGNPASRRYEITARDIETAMERCRRRVARFKRCMKVNGGGAVSAPVAPEAAADA